MEDIDTFSYTHLICPYCGYKKEVDFETFPPNALEWEFDCEECGKTFNGYRDVEFTYETTTKE